MNINTITQEVLDNLSLEERNEVLKILEEIKSDGHSASLDKLYEQDYDEVPVDIDTFIESDDYIGKFSNNGQLIYPYWREQLRRMFDPNDTYQEIALTGSIGIGKSTIACIAMAYLLYRTMCLKNPQEYYRLAAGSTIVFAFFNNTLDLTTSVGYGTIQNICQNSPWFLARGTVSGLKYKEYIPNKLIRFRIGSQAGHALGTNIISAMIDEVNFKVGANVRMEQSKIMETYNGVLERMGSRFMVNGKIAGKLFIVSSKKSEYDFLESYIRKKQDDPTVMVCDAKLWEVKPMGTYSGKTFKVAVGGSNLPSRILNDDEDVDSIIKQGYDVIYPPLEFKGRFEMDIQAALMNIAGISISHVTKFISYANLVKCYNTSKNPFTNNILTIGMSDSLKIQDFFIPELVPYEIYSMPLFVHLDTSLTGDKTGIGCVAAMGYKYYNEYSLDEGEVVPTKKLVYRHVFSVGIQCPQGTEISFQKTRDFIYYLKYTLGWNIRGISTDGFQSADTRQQLLTMGFDDVSLVSLDKTPNGYLTYKAAINEKRISMLNIPELETETIRLERDNMSGKVDHPVDGCVSGDTEILLIDKKNICHSIRIDEITNNYEKYKDCKVISKDEFGNTKLCEFINPRITKTVDKYIEIEMEDGSIIKCTHNHPILCKNGNEYFYKHAEDLTEEDDIVSLYDDLSKVVSDLRSEGVSYSKICIILEKQIIDLYINKEMTLRDISEIYGINRTVLNGFLSIKGIKRNSSKANLLAKKQGKNRGSVTLIKENEEYRSMISKIAKKNITKYNKSNIAREEKSNRIISNDTREKLREHAIERWKDPEYVDYMSKIDNGNGYGNHQNYYSNIFDKDFYLKSNVERMFVELCELIGCSSIEYETIRIPYTNESIVRTYIPDFLITVDGTKYLVEVKDRDGHSTGVNKLKYEAGYKYASDNNMGYLWLQRKDIIRIIKEVSSSEN